MKKITMNELIDIIDSFDENQKMRLELHKNENMKLCLERDKKILEKETDETFKEFLKKEIKFLELSIKKEE